jgi:hypothetical protein
MLQIYFCFFIKSNFVIFLQKENIVNPVVILERGGKKDIPQIESRKRP